MPERIENIKLYHVTQASTYKQSLVINQRITAGEKDNPFFGFYEGSREYPVTLEDGSKVQIKALAFLNQVRDGKINSPEIARIGAEVAKHYIMLCRELLMEEIRLMEFGGGPPSRQRCIYGCDSAAEARYWNQRLGGAGVVCELSCTGLIHRADARLLLADSEPLSETKRRARAYWRGELSGNPEMETLFAGEAIVTRFDVAD